MTKQNCNATSAALSVVYDKDVHTVAKYLPLNTFISLGTCNSDTRSELNPIDLMAMGLGSCLLILMGKTAVAERLDIVGARADVGYDLVDYKLTAFRVDIHLPKKLAAPDQAKLEAASKTCPVHLAIHPDVRVSVNFHWPN